MEILLVIGIALVSIPLARAIVDHIAENYDKLLRGIWKHLLRPALGALIIGFLAAIITQDTAVTSFGAIGGLLAGYFIDRS